MIGVLIGDITGLGVTEPYRMLTTRSENRLLQRFDNSDERLTPDGIKLGLIDQEQQEVFRQKCSLFAAELERLENFTLSMTEWKKIFPS